MAAAKYFQVINQKSGAIHLVKAPKEALAIGVIAGGADAIKLATNDEITAHYANGGTLHEKSCEKGSAGSCSSRSTRRATCCSARSRRRTRSRC